VHHGSSLRCVGPAICEDYARMAVLWGSFRTWFDPSLSDFFNNGGMSGRVRTSARCSYAEMGVARVGTEPLDILVGAKPCCCLRLCELLWGPWASSQKRRSVDAR
jgi:hypothetical protein